MSPFVIEVKVDNDYAFGQWILFSTHCYSTLEDAVKDAKLKHQLHYNLLEVSDDSQQYECIPKYAGVDSVQFRIIELTPASG